MPFVSPSFEAVAKPSISPSDTKSKKVANCLLCKLSGVLVGCGAWPTVFSAPPDPLIIFFVMPVPAEYQLHH